MLTYPVGLLKSKIDLIPRVGLIGEWKIESNADDTSGEGNNGVVTGATLTTNKNGDPNSAYHFNGLLPDEINLGQPAVLTDIAANDFSISLWAKDEYTTDSWGRLWSSWDSGNFGVLTGTNKIITETDRRVRFEVFFNTTNMQYDSVYQIVIGTWYYYTFIFDAATKTGQIFINNVEVSYLITTAGSGTLKSDSTIDKRIGKLNNTIQQNWLGDIDLIRIYNKKLTLNERTLLYNEL